MINQLFNLAFNLMMAPDAKLKDHQSHILNHEYLPLLLIAIRDISLKTSNMKLVVAQEAAIEMDHQATRNLAQHFVLIHQVDGNNSSDYLFGALNECFNKFITI